MKNSILAYSTGLIRLFIGSLLALSAPLAAAPATPLTSFDTDGRVSTDLGETENAAALITQPDGKVLLLVNRGTAQRASVLRYTVTGALDPTFSGDGRVDLSVSASTSDAVTGITLQNDGKVVVTGHSTFADGSRHAVVARFLADGSPDTSFDTDGVVNVNAANLEYSLTGSSAQAIPSDVAVQTDGKIVVGGQVRRNTSNKNDGLVVRFNADGSLDTGFGGNGVVAVQATTTESTNFTGLEIQPDGKIVAAGGRVVSGFDFQCVVARLTTSGALDTTFDTDGLVLFDANLNEGGAHNEIDQVWDVKLAPDGGILLAIQAETASFNSVFFLARLNRSNGALDTSFGGNGIINTGVAGTPSKMDVQGDGRIVLSGSNSSFNTAILRRNANGTADTTWDSDGLWTSTATSQSNGLHVGPDGRVYASALDNAFTGGSAHVWALEGNAVVSHATVSPADNATGVGAADNLVITFPSAVAVNSGSIQIIAANTFTTLESIPVGDGRVTGGGTNAITINPTATLAASTKYYVVLPHDGFREGSTPVRGIFNTEWEFTTSAGASMPTVSTATQSGVTHNSATLGGNVTADGGASVTDRGIVWGTSADPTTGNNKVQIGTGTGVFSQLVTGLPPSSTVHVRAYAINTAGTAYGSNISFATNAAPTPQIAVSFGGNAVEYNAVTTSSTNGTDFGSAPVAGVTVDRTFNITNNGTAELTLGTVTTTGDFSVQSQPSSSVAASGGTTSFIIRFNPAAAGPRSGTVSFSTNETGKTPFNFAVQGIGTGPQTFDLAGNAISNTPFDGGETYIYVTNTAPVISSNGGGSTAAVNVAENSTVVTTVTAADSDMPAQTLTYSITGGADQLKFSIASGTGVLTFQAAPDFETRTDANDDNVYELEVTVTDSGAGNLTDTQAISVTVTNVNEMPSFVKGLDQLLPFNTSSAQTAAGWATAINDGDSTVTQGLTFNISSNSNPGIFTTAPSIVSSTGTLTYTPRLYGCGPTCVSRSVVQHV